MQTAILFPVALLLIFGIIQGALWFHARHVALGAAQQGARAASAESGTGGEQRAHEFVAGLTGGTLLRDLAVTETTSGDTVTRRSRFAGRLSGRPADHWHGRHPPQVGVQSNRYSRYRHKGVLSHHAIWRPSRR